MNADSSPRSDAPPGDALRFEAAVGLVGELAHDLNNSLLVIRGYGSLLHEALREPQHLADVDEIVKAADNATAITGRLLDLGRARLPAA